MPKLLREEHRLPSKSFGLFVFLACCLLDPEFDACTISHTQILISLYTTTTNRSGRTIAITRGVNLDRSNFAGQDLKGVAFQQSIVRDANFQNCNLVGASFFDATLDGSDFENAYVIYVCVCVIILMI